MAARSWPSDSGEPTSLDTFSEGGVTGLHQSCTGLLAAPILRGGPPLASPPSYEGGAESPVEAMHFSLRDGRLPDRTDLTDPGD
jgi:hypothetical protein